MFPLTTWQTNTVEHRVMLTADQNYLKKYRNTISQAMRQASEILLETVKLEF